MTRRAGHRARCRRSWACRCGRASYRARGTEFTRAVLVTDPIRARLQTLVDLAPLHLPKSLAVLDLLRRLLPDAPTVACFDTAFHATLPPAASTYALPAESRRRWPLRRFGFHGLSHSWAASRAAERTHCPADNLRVVTCHLGAGASLAAVHNDISVDTTMGFTPLGPARPDRLGRHAYHP